MNPKLCYFHLTSSRTNLNSCVEFVVEYGQKTEGQEPHHQEVCDQDVVPEDDDNDQDVVPEDDDNDQDVVPDDDDNDQDVVPDDDDNDQDVVPDGGE